MTTEVYVLNTTTGSISTYTSSQWSAANGIANLDNFFYVVSPSGFYQVTGSFDDGTVIDAYLETGQLYFDTPMPKRLTHIRATIGSTDVVTVYAAAPVGGVDSPTYYPCSSDRSGSTSDTHLAPRGFNPPRGLKYDTYGVKIANVSGSGLSIQEMSVDYVETGFR